jgi:hypothetical protein
LPCRAAEGEAKASIASIGNCCQFVLRRQSAGNVLAPVPRRD